MFKPVEPGIVDTIAKDGKIEFRPFNGWEKQSVKRLYFMGIPHAIIYHVKNNEFNTLRWFDCKLSVLNRTIVVDDIEVSPKSLFSSKDKEVEKPLVHMGLGLVIDASIELALEHKKEKVVISSALPGIADVLLERNFIMKTKDLFDNINTTKRFRGMKTLGRDIDEISQRSIRP